MRDDNDGDDVSNLPTLYYKFFIQLPATLTKLCHIKRDHHHNNYYAQNVHHRPKRMLGGPTEYGITSSHSWR